MQAAVLLLAPGLLELPRPFQPADLALDRCPLLQHLLLRYLHQHRHQLRQRAQRHHGVVNLSRHPLVHHLHHHHHQQQQQHQHHHHLQALLRVLPPPLVLVLGRSAVQAQPPLPSPCRGSLQPQARRGLRVQSVMAVIGIRNSACG